MKRRHGWFIIPGLQTGDRTLEEQIHGVLPVVRSCAGMTVLDLGCAEGLISHEFARAGARRVLAVDGLEDHLQVAREHYAHPVIVYTRADLNVAIRQDALGQFDVVLALAVLQKLDDPKRALEWAASMVTSGGVLLLRNGKRERNGMLISKIDTGRRAPIKATLEPLGLTLEQVAPGHPKRPEDKVQYWRRA